LGQQALFHQQTMAENMDLSPYRPKGTVSRERLRQVYALFSLPISQ